MMREVNLWRPFYYIASVELLLLGPISGAKEPLEKGDLQTRSLQYRSTYANQIPKNWNCTTIIEISVKRNHACH